MENKEYKKYPISEELSTQIAKEIASAKIETKMKDCDIANAMGKTRQNYSKMLNGLQSLGNIEAIANILGYNIEIKFIKRGV